MRSLSLYKGDHFLNNVPEIKTLYHLTKNVISYRAVYQGDHLSIDVRRKQYVVICCEEDHLPYNVTGQTSLPYLICALIEHTGEK